MQPPRISFKPRPFNSPAQPNRDVSIFRQHGIIIDALPIIRTFVWRVFAHTSPIASKNSVKGRNRTGAGAQILVPSAS